MLRTRKSLTNLLQSTPDGPYLIYFRYWFETKYREGTTIKIQFSKRPIYTIKNYVPGDKYIIIDIIKKNQQPVCFIESNDVHITIDFKKYIANSGKQYNVIADKFKIIFHYQLFSNTSEIQSIYSSQKINQQQKYRFGQSINDLIRSQAEFLSKFEKDTELQDIKKVQKVQQDIQSKLSQQLLHIKSIRLNIKRIIIIFIIFFILGYLISSDNSQKIQKKKKIKKTKKNKQ